MKIITNELVEGFKYYLLEEEKSQRTVEKYLRDINGFASWCSNRELNKLLVLEYKKSISEKYASASVNSMLSSLNSFFEYTGWHDMKVKTVKIQRQMFVEREKELNKNEYNRLLNAAKSNEQLYLMIQTIASTGIRISELSSITVEAVNSEKAVIRGKGKLRQIFLSKPLCKALKKYIKKRDIKNGFVFVTRTGKPIDRTRVWKLLKGLCESANVSKEKVFPHNLRHLFARTFYSIRNDIVRLADILGHSSINTTRIYTIESGAEHKKQLQKLGLLRC